MTSENPRSPVADSATLMRVKYPLALSADAASSFRPWSRSRAAGAALLPPLPFDLADCLELLDEAGELVCSCGSLLFCNAYLGEWVSNGTGDKADRRLSGRILVG